MKTLIKNGRLIDPAQRIDAELNLLIADGKVDSVTQSEPEADCIIDAGGKIVCPGFLDMHAHEDPLENGEIYRDEEKANLACLLRMGVTTCLCGNCGDNFVDPSQFLERYRDGGCFVNAAMLAGYTYFREKYSAADRYSPATQQEQETIVRELAKALENGCAGISFGLEYVPGISGNELRAAAELCSGSGRLIAAHIRACAEGAVPATKEIMDAAKEAGIPVQISHIGSMAGYGQMRELLKTVDEYRANGLSAGCDCYPYDAFSTTIGSAPYDDPASIHCRYEDIEICEGKHRGKRCTRELFEEERKNHPEYLTAGHVINEEEIIRAYRHPNVMVGSDAFLNHGSGHPRAAGAFPRFLRVYAPACGLSLFEAIARVTVLPAGRLGLRNKGTLKPGADADLVIFDPESIADHSSFEHPTAAPGGIAWVLINGLPAVKDGKITNGSLGRALRIQQIRQYS